ncbi:ParB/RepB/Spo0J family partition protein [Patescibacteria group bacterium]|nr:ParB/RepB/Spo0J family partition protein [Patescibacteria group bacterium]
MATAHPTSLPLNQLQPNPLQPRGKMNKDELQELVSSVKTYGVLEPIVVAHTPAGYQIIAGERRWRAAKLAGLKEVPVVVKVTTPRGMLEMAVIENVQRVDLSPIERAQAFQQLLRDFKFSHQQIADKIGKSIAYVSNSLRLLNLPDAIKDGLAGGLISEGHARALASIENERHMIECYKQILKEGASVRRAEELVRRFKQVSGQTPNAEATEVGRVALHNTEIDTWQNKLQDVFKEDTKVKLVISHRQTKLTLVFKGTPEETKDEIMKVMELTKKK